VPSVVIITATNNHRQNFYFLLVLFCIVGLKMKLKKLDLNAMMEAEQKKTKNMEISFDWRPVWRQDHWPGQALNIF